MDKVAVTRGFPERIAAMIEWKERAKGLGGIAYEPPGGIAPLPIAPRAAFEATGADGAKLEAYRWGSALGTPFVLELRRYGAPEAGKWMGRQPPPLEIVYGAPELPTLGEIQSAIDQLVPPGSSMMLLLVSNGPDQTYAYEGYACLRMGQLAAQPARMVQ